MCSPGTIPERWITHRRDGTAIVELSSDSTRQYRSWDVRSDTAAPHRAEYSMGDVAEICKWLNLRAVNYP